MSPRAPRLMKVFFLLILASAFLLILYPLFYENTSQTRALDVEPGHWLTEKRTAKLPGQPEWRHSLAVQSAGTATVSRIEAESHGVVIPPAGVINPHNFRYLLRPSFICTPGLFLFIYVHSAPKNFKKRQMIRQTWGEPDLLQTLNSTIIFLMGKTPEREVMEAVHMESSRYGDILQEDFVDSYRNLTYKGISGLKWVTENCLQARYAFKTDDDILVDIIYLSRILQTRFEATPQRRPFIVCNRWANMVVIRDAKSKWFVSKSEYPGKIFDPYCSGSAFVISSDVIPLMYRTSLQTPFMWVDDYYITGALVKKLNVSLTPFNEAYVLSEGKAEEKLANDTTGSVVIFHVRSLRMFYKVWTIVMKRNHITRLPLVESIFGLQNSTSKSIKHPLSPKGSDRKSNSVSLRP